jgi:hypothetical protein
VRIPLAQVGLFAGKACFFAHGSNVPEWPAGDNLRIKVEPAHTACANTMYSAFVRQFGASLHRSPRSDAVREKERELDRLGYTVVPPSGTFRDLIRNLDAILRGMRFRILQLLPVHPTPVTYGRMGRYGSAFAALDFLSVDPALAEFDKRATPLDQFRELVDAVHGRSGFLFMDLPANHTGWAATLQTHHPDWYRRKADGEFVSPGAWGVTWDDLVELDYRDPCLRAYMADCQASPDCPFPGSVDDGLARIRALLDVIRSTPLPTGDPARPLTYSLAVSGIVLPMYESAIWPQLTAALDAAITGNDGSQLLYFADLGAGRLDDGSYEDNSNEAFMAINCLDYPVEGTLADWKADAERMKEISPTLGDALAWTEITCDVWPYESTRAREPIAASGSAPILVIGTTGDPATPYEWAVDMADQLDQGHLLTFDGDGHTAYGRSNQCVTDAVDRFMTRGQLPPEGATC